jgi:polyisoprenyl-teichoic acid--peptidoglycan teichoic acid transferase
MRITLDDSEVKRPPIKKERVKIPKRVKNGNRNTNITSKVKLATKIIFGLVGVLLVVFISYGGYLAYKTYKAGKQIGLNLRPSDVISQELATLKKDSSGKYTNALIIGIDTRERGNLLNTDSIILLSYNHEAKDVIMLSIPRDLHVEIKPETHWYNRINSVYSSYEDSEKALYRLREIVSEITNKEIQYHAMIDYKGFVELIDTLGGINVNVENSFTDYQYPEGFGYKTVRFQEGPQLMDGDTALEYARSRHSMQNNEGSDFARARRQQKVITAVSEKITSSSLLDPQSIMSLFNVIQDNVKISEFTLNDVEAGVKELQKFRDTGETYSFVLDPNAGGGKLLSENVVNTEAYAIAPITGLGNYEAIHEYINVVWSMPQLYEEDPTIRVYNTGLGYTETKDKYIKLTQQFPYLKIYYAGTLYNDKEGIVSYINSASGFTDSLRILNKYIKPDSTEKPEYITTRLNAEDITVLYGSQVVKDDDTQPTE